MRHLRLLAVAALAGCGGLSQAAANSLRSAQEQDLLIYRIPVDGGSPARGLSRGAYCSVDVVLRDYDAGTFDSGGAITCPGAKP